MAESTNQTQQINSFTEGMNTDVSEALLKDSQYRLAKNMRLATNTAGNGYVLHSIEGTSSAVTFTGATISGTIIEMTNIRNLNVIITCVINQSPAFCPWYVYTFNIDNNSGTDTAPSYTLKQVFGCTDTVNGKELNRYYDDDGEDMGINLSLVTKWEDSDNIKLYIADGGNPIRIINLALTYSVTSDDTLFIYPSNTFSKLEVIGFTTGSLKAGIYLYCYQLYNKNGSETELSPLTEQIPLSLGDQSSSSLSILGLYLDNSTSKAVMLKLSGIDTTKFNRIKIISVFYYENGLTPTISLLANLKFTTSDFYYTDYNGTAESVYTLDEFNAITGVKFIPKLIETKNNYLFASNVQYQDNAYSVDYDARAYRYLYINDLPTGVDVVTSGYLRTVTDTISGSLFLTYTDAGNTFTFGIGYYTNGTIWTGLGTQNIGESITLKLYGTVTTAGTLTSGTTYCLAYTSGVPNVITLTSGPATLIDNGDLSYTLTCTGSGTIVLNSTYYYTYVENGVNLAYNTPSFTFNVNTTVANDFAIDQSYPSHPATINASQMTTSIYNQATNAYTTFTLSSIPTVDDEHDCINKYNDLSINSYLFHRYYSSTDYTRNKYAYFYDTQSSLIIYGGCGTNVKYKLVVGELAEDSATGTTDVSDTDGLSRSTYYGNPTVNCDSESKSFEGIWTYNVACDGSFVNRHFVNLIDETNMPLNYSNTLIAMNLRSLQRDEVYRYGIIFYNKRGLACPVKWIADIRTPSMTELGFETFMANKSVSFLSDSSDLYLAGLVTRPLGVEFEVTMPSDAVSYEIVRCNRGQSDRATLTQGVISTLMDNTPTTNVDETDSSSTIDEVLFPSDVVITQPYTVNANSEFTEHHFTSAFALAYYNFYSPEVAYEYETMLSSLNYSDLKLSPLKLVFSSTRPMSNHPSYLPFSYFKSTNDGVITSSTGYRNPDNDFRFSDSSHNTLVYNGTRDIVYNVAKFYEQANLILDNTSTQYRINNNMFLLTDLAFPVEPTWNSYSTRNDYQTAIKSYIYNNWVRTCYTVKPATDPDVGTVQGPGGRSILIAVNSTNDAGSLYKQFGICSVAKRLAPVAHSSTTEAGNETEYRTPGSYTSGGVTTTYTDYPEGKAGTYICNLRRSVTPYGGYGYASRITSTYYSLGLYFTTGSAYKTIFDGDTYICNFDCVKMHKYYYSDTSSSYGTDKTDTTKKLLNRYVSFLVPLESVINVSLDQGPTYHRSKSSNIQIVAANVNEEYSLTTPLYTYNTVYSQLSKARIFTPDNADDEYNKLIDVRTHYSETKSTDELVDSWSKFKAANYLDVDSRYGPITDTRTFNNDLIFWQRDATGHYSVMEKSMITDESNTTLVLGTGTVLSRYDYLSTVNGMKALLMCDTQSEGNLYWFDYDRCELCRYATGEGIESIGKTKGVLNYLNSIKSNATLLNKPALSYDRYYNELLATLTSSETLVYNGNQQAFPAIYDMSLEWGIMNDGDMFFVKSNNIYKSIHNKANNSAVSLLGTSVYPSIKYMVNTYYQNVKVFDNVEMPLSNRYNDNIIYTNFSIAFSTDSLTAMSSTLSGSNMTQREYSLRGAIPRYGSSTFGNRLRGRVLYCTLTYNSNLYGFELPYALTKFRISNI